MANTTTLKAIGLFNLSYRTEFDDERLDFYVRMLADIHSVTLEKACENLICTSKFLPTIAEIREECEKISAVVNNRKTEIDYSEAWRLVMHAADKKGHDYGLQTLPPMVRTAADRLGWHDICYGDLGNLSTMKAQFRNIYNILIEQERESTRLTKSIGTSEPLKIYMEKNQNKVAELTSGLSEKWGMK